MGMWDIDERDWDGGDGKGVGNGFGIFRGLV